MNLLKVNSNLINQISLEKFIGKKIIEINDMYLILMFDGEESLTVECSWRLRNEKIILVGSSEHNSQKDNQEVYEKLSNLLLGQKIKDILCRTHLNKG